MKKTGSGGAGFVEDGLFDFRLIEVVGRGHDPELLLGIIEGSSDVPHGDTVLDPQRSQDVGLDQVVEGEAGVIRIRTFDETGRHPLGKVPQVLYTRKMTRIELERRVLELPEEERLEVAEAIWASLDDPDAVPTLPWQRELIAERLAESETEEGRDWEEIRAEIWPGTR